MGLSITTVAPYTRLTDLQSVKDALDITVTTFDNILRDLIDAATAAIVSYCHRPFGREAYTETLPGFGGINLQLRRTPIVTVSTVTVNSATYTDYSIGEAGRGWLYRQAGWSWTVQCYMGLSGGGAWLDRGQPLPNQEEPQVSVSYVAGYIMPEQDVATTVSVVAADQSFNDSASSFPALLKAGDIVFASGFTNAVNNGQFVVTGTPTTSKIIVSSTALVNEAAGAGKALKVSNLPADLEQAARETAKTWYLSRKDDPTIVEKQAGPMRLRYSEQQDMLQLGLPASVIGLLRPWVRAA